MKNPNTTCIRCGAFFYKKPAELKRHRTSFCSSDCHKQYRVENKSRHTFVCGQCGETVSKYVSPTDIKEMNFCSQSCSASFQNKRSPKRKPQGKCQTCGAAIPSGKTFCAEHKKVRVPIAKMTVKKCAGNPKVLRGRNQKTLGEAKNTTGRPANAFTGVRFNARVEMEEAKIPKVCAACGYSKHVQCCHKKPISSFPPETLIGVVNALSNLVWLCPNCHWEYDHGQLTL